MTEEDIESIFAIAANNAMLYGMGLIKLTNTPTGIMVDVIQPEEYIDVAVALEWAAKNTIKVVQ
jgi:hypothetical protein